MKKCDVCEKEMPFYFMVRDEIWEQHGNGEGMMCHFCLVKKMGRGLMPHDFTRCHLNIVDNPQVQSFIGYSNDYSRGYEHGFDDCME